MEKRVAALTPDQRQALRDVRRLLVAEYVSRENNDCLLEIHRQRNDAGQKLLRKTTQRVLRQLLGRPPSATELRIALWEEDENDMNLLDHKPDA